MLECERTEAGDEQSTLNTALACRKVDRARADKAKRVNPMQAVVDFPQRLAAMTNPRERSK